jgi:hypothetical protein
MVPELSEEDLLAEALSDDGGVHESELDPAVAGEGADLNRDAGVKTDEDEEKADDAGSDSESETPADEEGNKENEELDPKSGIPVSVQKRIDAITAEKGRLAEKLAVAEAEAKAAKESLERLAANPVTVEPTEENPLADVSTVDELKKRVDNARAIRKWCLENLEGGVVKNREGEDVEISAEQVRKRLAETDDLLMEHAPRRMAWLKQAEQFDVEARADYPDLFNAKSELFAEAVSYLKVLPEIQRFPDWKQILGDAIAGRKARLAAKESAKTKAAGAVAPVKAAVEKPKLAPRVAEPVAAGFNGVRSDRKKAEARVLESNGDEAAMESFFMAEG